MPEEVRSDESKTIIRGIERAYIEKDSLNKKKRAKKMAGSNKETTEPTSDLIDIAEESQEQLLSMTTKFPMQLFPDTVTVDRQKLTIIHRTFFSSFFLIKRVLFDIGSFYTTV